MEGQRRRNFLLGCCVTTLSCVSGCSFAFRPMADFSLINEDTERSHTVRVVITSTDDDDELHDETYQVEPGWSRLIEEDVFESQQCQFEITVDGSLTDSHTFLPSCRSSDSENDNLDIGIDPPETEYFQKTCSDGV